MVGRSKEFLKYAIPCSGTMILNWWPLEFITIFSVIMGTIQLTANAMLSNIFLLFCDISLGFEHGAVAVIGNSLGENLPIKTNVYKNASLIVWLSMSLFTVILLFIREENIIKSHSLTDEEADLVRNVFITFLWHIITQFIYETTQEILYLYGYQFLLMIFVALYLWVMLFPTWYVFSFTIGFGNLGLRIDYLLCNTILVLTNILII